ncbi:MAG: site-2 protease family protein [Parachlamydiaceae bacterium]|nr:site-2 protease family protein [Parachlamydiaceae bacterium]
MALVSLFYTLLAVLGLGFLIFIHELGHYWMAKRVGMRVETFAIGFGRPIFSWMHDGTKWQIGWLPFGGYVKIAGAETDSEVDPYSIKDGFYGRGPWARIKVALMGPLVNLLFAFIAFGILWSFGGREKSFVEVTSKIGWVDPQSELYAKGIRPGDEIIAYDDHPFQGIADHKYAVVLASDQVNVQGIKEDYVTGEKTPFEYKVAPYQHPEVRGKGKMTLGVMSPAHYLIYNRLPNNAENPLSPRSPLLESGLQYGDRVIWVDGELVFSNKQLEDILNDGRVLLTIKRGNDVSLMRIPRVNVRELKLDPAFKEEISDWQFEAQLKNIKLQDLYVLPYNLTNDCIVENALSFLDSEKSLLAFPTVPFSALEGSLQPGDRILAIDGIRVEKSYELLKDLQTRHVNIMVQRDGSAIQKIGSKVSDFDFDKHIDMQNINRIASSIGTEKEITSSGNLALLKPITPLPSKEFDRTPEDLALLSNESKASLKEIESIEDPVRRGQMLASWKPYEERFLIGLPIQDRKVTYNPSAIELFKNVFKELSRVFYAIFERPASRDWLSGPVGIVRAVHDSWMLGYKEALFWLGVISMNLGVLNLLPIPVLDGGVIVLSLFELLTGRKLKPKTLERLIVPFAILLICFFVFVTYNDVLRLFGLWK